MSVHVTTLVEDSPAFPGGEVGGEHGLALLVEADGLTILFDAGASGLVARNADAMGLGSALAHLDAMVLSHGHCDHTGGLPDVLVRLEGPTPVYTGPGLFARRVDRSASGSRDIGVPVSRARLEALGARLHEDGLRREIGPGVFLSGRIERREAGENPEEGLCVVRSGGTVEPDDFADERALAVRTPLGVVVLVGCAHRGLVNSISAAREAAGETRVRAVLGGAHLRSATRGEIDRAVDEAARLEPEIVALGHCTGEEAGTRLGEAFGDRFEPLRAGASWTFD